MFFPSNFRMSALRQGCHKSMSLLPVSSNCGYAESNSSSATFLLLCIRSNSSFSQSSRSPPPVKISPLGFLLLRVSANDLPPYANEEFTMLGVLVSFRTPIVSRLFFLVLLWSWSLSSREISDGVDDRSLTASLSP